jgi:hypothetical protein
MVKNPSLTPMKKAALRVSKAEEKYQCSAVH